MNTLFITVLALLFVCCNQAEINHIEAPKANNTTVLHKSENANNEQLNKPLITFPITITCSEQQLKRIDWNEKLPKELERHIIYFVQETDYGLLVFYEYSAHPDFDDELVFTNVMYAATYNSKNELIVSLQLIDANCDMVNADGDGSEMKRSEQKIIIKSTNEFTVLKKIEKILDNQAPKLLLNEEINYMIKPDGTISKLK